MNRRRLLSSCFALALVLCGCGKAAKPRPTEPWATGFWVWNAEAAAPSSAIVDVLYVQAPFSDKVPKAREYWLTFRESNVCPNRIVSPAGQTTIYDPLGDRLVTANIPGWMDALKGRSVRGLQLDIDCPTRSLVDYAKFLAEVRKQLPPGKELSITALLDWFRDGTDIAKVIEQVDEFVPQFYDVGNAYDDPVIAAKVDAEKWAPRFNRFEKRYRIGISTFGRGRLPFSRKLYRAIMPLDVANDRNYRLTSEHNESGELVLNYDPIQGGERTQFIVPTPESVRAAVESAKKMGGYAAGVVFFRWPNAEETLVMPPEEVLGLPLQAAALETEAGDCVAVSCADLYLVRASRFTPAEVEYRIHTSIDIEYAVPSELLPIRVTSPKEMVVRIPPFGAKPKLHLGRVVTSKPAVFTLEVR
ncbi:MAG: DUF3142 domain-containing protein [Bryobacteraceae bacterium]